MRATSSALLVALLPSVRLLVALVLVTGAAACGDLGESGAADVDHGGGGDGGADAATEDSGSSGDPDGGAAAADDTGADATGPDGTASGGDAASGPAGDAVVGADAEDVANSDPTGTGDAVVGPDGAASDAAGPAADGAGPSCDGGLELEPGVLQASCEQVCDSIVSSGCDLGPVGGDAEGCVAQCVTDVTCDGWQLGNYTCFEEQCNATLCQIGGAPLDEEPACNSACAALDTCDLLSFIDQPEDEPEVCLAVCAGAAAGNPALGPLLECIADAADPTCDAVAIEGCLTGQVSDLAGSCASFCASFLEPGGNDYCAPGSGIYDTWADSGECVDACVENMPDVEASLRMFGCMLAVSCGPADVCLAMPEADEPACTEGCDAIEGLCGEGAGGLADPGFCSPLCTGIGVVLGGVNPDAGQCVTDSGACPGSSDEIGGLLFTCIIPSSDECEAICTAFEPCLPEEALDPAQCVSFCSLGAGPFADVTTLLQCIEAAPGGACPAILACIPEDGPQRGSP